MLHFWVLFLGQVIMTLSSLILLLISCSSKRSNRHAGSEPNSDGRVSDHHSSGIIGQGIPPPATGATSTPQHGTAATPTAASTPAAPLATASAQPAQPPPPKAQPPSTGNDSKPDVVQIIVVDGIQKSPKAGGTKEMPDTDKCAVSPKQTDNSKKGTNTSAKETKDTRSTKEQGTGAGRTDGSSRPRKFEPRNEAERKQLEDIKKGKFGNTIDDDTLNDADHEWGEGDVIYKGSRSNKKKKKRR